MYCVLLSCLLASSNIRWVLAVVFGALCRNGTDASSSSSSSRRGRQQDSSTTMMSGAMAVRRTSESFPFAIVRSVTRFQYIFLLFVPSRHPLDFCTTIFVPEPPSGDTAFDIACHWLVTQRTALAPGPGTMMQHLEGRSTMLALHALHQSMHTDRGPMPCVAQVAY